MVKFKKSSDLGVILVVSSDGEELLGSIDPDSGCFKSRCGGMDFSPEDLRAIADKIDEIAAEDQTFDRTTRF